MKPRKGMTAQKIVKILQEGLEYYERMSQVNWRNRNQAGYEACEHRRLYIACLLDEIAE